MSTYPELTLAFRWPSVKTSKGTRWGVSKLGPRVFSLEPHLSVRARTCLAPRVRGGKCKSVIVFLIFSLVMEATFAYLRFFMLLLHYCTC